MQGKVVGTLAELWRYPIKSMAGEQISNAVVTERGILGDRAYAIREQATGHIASAKHPRKWRTLLQCRAAFAYAPQPNVPLPPVLISLPDGTTVSSEQSDVDQILSQVFGRQVRLIQEAPPAATREADRSPLDAPAETIIRQEALATAAPDGTFFDYAPLHLISTATIAQLQRQHPAGRFDLRRFRPNLLITPANASTDPVEYNWLGQSLHVGTAQLRLIDPAPRCVITTLAQADLPHDPTILRTIAAQPAVASATLAPDTPFAAVAGVYATVEQDGTLHIGTELRLAD